SAAFAAPARPAIMVADYNDGTEFRMVAALSLEGGRDISVRVTPPLLDGEDGKAIPGTINFAGDHAYFTTDKDQVIPLGELGSAVREDHLRAIRFPPFVTVQWYSTRSGTKCL